MRVVPLAQLRFAQYSISRVAAIYQTPVYRAMTNRGRGCNGFLLMDRGECLYRWAGGEARLVPGSLIYLPYGSRHQLEVRTAEFAFYRVDFTLIDDAGDELIFSEGPLPLAQAASLYLRDNVRALTEHFLRSSDVLRSTSLICAILSEVTRQFESARPSRLTPVLDYLADHYREEIDCAQLCELCYLSPAQMYRLFREETGTTPIEYRNRLRIQRACQLLRGRECTIGEIAALLGFESVYYFSRVFKKLTGVAPSRW